MKDRISHVVLLLVTGWLLGYVHHHFATRVEHNALRSELASMEQQVSVLKSAIPAVKKVHVKTTAYSNDSYSINVPAWLDDRTASNTLVRPGVVAADWRVFPPGTRLYIPGYGEAVVEDRGSGVKGNHLDLFMLDRQEALTWGVRDVDVYVIEKGRIGSPLTQNQNNKTKNL